MRSARRRKTYPSTPTAFESLEPRAMLAGLGPDSFSVLGSGTAVLPPAVSGTNLSGDSPTPGSSGNSASTIPSSGSNGAESTGLALPSNSGSGTGSSGSGGNSDPNSPVLSSQYTGGSNAGGQGTDANDSSTFGGSDLWLLYSAGLGAASSSTGGTDSSSSNLLALFSQYKDGASADGQGNDAGGTLSNADLWIFYRAGAGAGSSSGSTDGSLANDPTILAQYTGGSGIGRITPLVYQFGSDDGPGFHSGVWTGDDGAVQFVTVSEGEGAPPPKPDAAAASVGLFDWWRNLWRSVAKPATAPVDLPRGADIPALGLPDQLPATRPDGTLDPVLNNSVDQAAIAAGKLVFDPVTRSWTSPGGLEYGPRLFADGNAVNHVLDHLVPNSAKKRHTVFAVDRTKLIETIDEAFGKRDEGVLQGDYRKFEVEMGRVIGTNGETRIRILILDGTRKVITAYPIN